MTRRTGTTRRAGVQATVFPCWRALLGPIIFLIALAGQTGATIIVFDRALLLLVGHHFIFGQTESIRHARIAKATSATLTTAPVRPALCVNAVGLAPGRRWLTNARLATDKALTTISALATASVRSTFLVQALLLALLHAKTGIVTGKVEAAVPATAIAAVGTTLLARALRLARTLADPLEATELPPGTGATIASAAI